MVNAPEVVIEIPKIEEVKIPEPIIETPKIEEVKIPDPEPVVEIPKIEEIKIPDPEPVLLETPVIPEIVEEKIEEVIVPPIAEPQTVQDVPEYNPAPVEDVKTEDFDQATQKPDPWQMRVPAKEVPEDVLKKVLE